MGEYIRGAHSTPRLSCCVCVETPHRARVRLRAQQRRSVDARLIGPGVRPTEPDTSGELPSYDARRHRNPARGRADCA
jgi:hypothetical protein